MRLTLDPVEVAAVSEPRPTMGSGATVFALQLHAERERTAKLAAFVRDVAGMLNHRLVPGGHHHAECLVCRAEELLKGT